MNIIINHNHYFSLSIISFQINLFNYRLRKKFIIYLYFPYLIKFNRLLIQYLLLIIIIK